MKEGYMMHTLMCRRLGDRRLNLGDTAIRGVVNHTDAIGKQRILTECARWILRYREITVAGGGWRCNPKSNSPGMSLLQFFSGANQASTARESQPLDIVLF